jgi:hypothetical protein
VTLPIKIDRRYSCSHKELWSSITDPKQLSDWLGGQCSIEPRVGGAVTLDLPADSFVATGEVRAFDPPRDGFDVAFLEHTLVDQARPDITSVCRWAAVDDPPGSSLHFTHDGFGEAGDPRSGLAAALVGEAAEALRSAKTILLVSYIGPEVPVTLAEAGFTVYAKSGPGPNDWSAIDAADGELVATPMDAPPVSVDLVHLDVSTAFDEYVGVAQQLGAKTFWFHSARTRPPEPHDNRGCWLPAAQSQQQREIVELTGMTYIDDVYIAEVARLV